MAAVCEHNEFSVGKFVVICRRRGGCVLTVVYKFGHVHTQKL